MENKNLVHILPNSDDEVFTQTSFSGKLRWYCKPLYDEPVLQQEEVIHYFKNGIVSKAETKWIDVPIVQYTIE